MAGITDEELTQMILDLTDSAPIERIDPLDRRDV